jgi:heme-degrading monooxygenase HmoA
MRRDYVGKICLFGTVLALFAGCSTNKKVPANGFSSGYEKITVAAADRGEKDNEVIKPEYITEVKKNNAVYTLMHIHYAKSGRQQSLVDTQINEFRKMFGKVPGLVSFNLHKGNGGVRVINYVQFETKDVYDAWQASASFREYMAAIKPFTAKTETEVFDVVYVQH